MADQLWVRVGNTIVDVTQFSAFGVRRSEEKTETGTESGWSVTGFLSDAQASGFELIYLTPPEEKDKAKEQMDTFRELLQSLV